jgi:hypothetical protein
MCLHSRVQVAFLDYVRFLIGSMWASCTPESFSNRAADINQGMHKRSVPLHVSMVLKAVDCTRAYSEKLAIAAMSPASWQV